MKKMTLPLMAIAALLGAVPASATIYSVSFTGNVNQTTGATGEAVGNKVSGHFDVNSATGTFLDFVIDGLSIGSGYASSISIGPANTDAIYMAQISAVSSGGTTNQTFGLDLSALTSWPGNESPYLLLTDNAQLNNNLDMVTNPASAFPSTFNYYVANADGTNVKSLGVNLTSLAATAPEPASIALTGASLLLAGFAIRRRR